jgi:uncharacterized ubiquitin-like protein YukD
MVEGQIIDVIFNSEKIQGKIVLIAKNWIRIEYKGIILTISNDKILKN